MTPPTSDVAPTGDVHRAAETGCDDNAESAFPISALVVPTALAVGLSGFAVRTGVPISEAAVCLLVAGVGLNHIRQLPAMRSAAPWPRKRIALGTFGGLIGWAIGSWLLLAVAAMHLSRSAVTRQFGEWTRQTLRPWWPVAVMAVPWVWADAWWLGWQMRLTSAAAAELLLSPVVPELTRNGTSLVASGVCIDVAASCAGLGLLQATLTLGLAAAAFLTRSAALTVCAAPLLIAVAWVTNVARVVLLTLVAVFGNPDLASSTLHDIIGYGLLGLLAWGGWKMFDALTSPAAMTTTAEAA